MTSLEVKEQTGYAESTVQKYAALLGVKYYGTGRRKVYDWTEADVKKFCETIKNGEKRDHRGRPPQNTWERYQNYVFTNFEQLHEDVEKGFIDENFASFILDDYDIPNRTKVLLAWGARIEKRDNRAIIFIGNRLDGEDISDAYLYADDEGNIAAWGNDAEWWQQSVLWRYSGIFGTVNFSEIVSEIEKIKKTKLNTENSKPTNRWKEVRWVRKEDDEALEKMGRRK
jgi:hypothetical protein